MVNNGNEILSSEIIKFQEALLQSISSSKFGISISNANSIIIEEHAKIYPVSRRLDVKKAVEIREIIIRSGAIEIGSEFVEVGNGNKFKPLIISS